MTEKRGAKVKPSAFIITSAVLQAVSVICSSLEAFGANPTPTRLRARTNRTSPLMETLRKALILTCEEWGKKKKKKNNRPKSCWYFLREKGKIFSFRCDFMSSLCVYEFLIWATELTKVMSCSWIGTCWNNYSSHALTTVAVFIYFNKISPNV